LVLEKYKRWLKVVFVSLVLLCVLAEIGSNRPLYHVLLSSINLGKGDWYQRAKLIDVAIERIDDWWLAGYGSRDPGWGVYFGANITDINNEFILAGAEAGILGVVALCAMLVTVFRQLSHASRRTEDVGLKSLYWSLGSALVGVIAAWQGVSFFGQMNALFYSILGIIGSSFVFAKKDRGFHRRFLGTGNTGYRYPVQNNVIYAFDRIRK